MFIAVGSVERHLFQRDRRSHRVTECMRSASRRSDTSFYLHWREFIVFNTPDYSEGFIQVNRIGIEIEKLVLRAE